LTALGSSTVLNVVIISVAGFLALRGRREMVALVLLSTYGGVLLSLFLKDFFERPRPGIVPHLVDVHSPSFPSGHSMLSAVVYLTLGALLARATAERSLKIYCLTIPLLLTFVIGFTRVYAGVHYPSDVLGGWAVGLLWALFCAEVARRLQRRGVVRRAD
jgi:undecaprenyl-diphosphatase